MLARAGDLDKIISALPVKIGKEDNNGKEDSTVKNQEMGTSAQKEFTAVDQKFSAFDLLSPQKTPQHHLYIVNDDHTSELVTPMSPL